MGISLQLSISGEQVLHTEHGQDRLPRKKLGMPMM